MDDINGFIIGLKRDDGSYVNIDVQPTSYLDANDNIAANGVYQLYKGHHGDDDQETGERDINSPDYLGDIAFHQDYRDEWEYIGEALTNDEQEQITLRIMSGSGSNDSEETFYVQAYYNGGMNSFEVIHNEGHFGVAYSGNVIAEIRNNENWGQISGDPLDKDVFISIKQAIEDKYK
jgi:hypothetical protein